jgi:hypothetical protein
MKTDDIIVLDNIIPKNYQNEIENMMTMPVFNWHFNKKISIGEHQDLPKILENDSSVKESSAFVHRFFIDPEVSTNKQLVKSDYCDFIRPIFHLVEDKTNIKINKVHRVRGVFVTKDITFKEKYNVPHVDSLTNHTVLIYYVNDNDGGTAIFKEKFSDNISFTSKKTLSKIVPAKKGRILLFNGLTYHTGIVPTDNHKILINVNFC